MLKLKHGNESYAGILPRLPPVIFLREHGRNLRTQFPGQPIGFARFGAIRLYCPSRFRIGHLNC
jgi:hypothetical protein